MIQFPASLEAALGALADGSGGQAQLRAGGTDLQHRRALGLAAGPVVDLRRLPDMNRVEVTPEGVRIGALVTVAQLAAEPAIRAGYPGLAAAAHDLATPQIRAVATVGGNLLQRNRCWYFRSPHYTCLKKGGSTCYAREGDHVFHSCFDLGPCVAPHPSTVGLALLAYDAQIEVAGAPSRPVSELYGDGSNVRGDNRLEPEAVLTAVLLPPPTPGEQSAYLRVASRALAEWPLVDVVVRLVVADGQVRQAAVTLGGVANVPLRHRAVEKALVGRPPGAETWKAAAAAAREGATPLVGTAYKVDLLGPAVEDAIERALASAPVAAPPPPAPVEPSPAAPTPTVPKRKGG